MGMYRLIMFLILVFPIPATPASTAEPTPTNVDEPGLVLPSETCRGLFIVPFTVGEGEGKTLDLLFDTGSSRTFVDPTAIRRIVGPGVRAGKILFKDGRIGRHKFGPLRANIYPMKTLSLALGRKIDGILGFPAFKDVLLTLDYPAEEIRVSSGNLPRPDGREIFRVTGSRRPFLKVDVGGRHVKVLLDSGSTGRFALRSTDRIQWSVEPRPLSAAVHFASVTIREGGRLDMPLQFGPLGFEAPVVAITRSEPLAGWHVLHNFVLTFDQKKNRIRMQPNGPTPVRMPSLVGSGMGLHPLPEGLKIIKVFPDTSAEAAGLRKGDLIIAIDGTPVYERGCGDPEGDPAGRREVWTYIRDGLQADAEIETEILVP